MTRMIRYTVKPDQIDENERLVRAVYQVLAQVKPAGIRYATYKLSDGASFVHVVSYQDKDGQQRLTSLPAFKAFSVGVAQRCETPPQIVEMDEIGSYDFADRDA